MENPGWQIARTIAITRKHNNTGKDTVVTVSESKVNTTETVVVSECKNNSKEDHPYLINGVAYFTFELVLPIQAYINKKAPELKNQDIGLDTEICTVVAIISIVISIFCFIL